MSSYDDYYEAGFRIFGLYGVTNGACDCGNPKCENLYKHPKVSSWQHTPYWSEEQFDAMSQYGQFETGFGVLCDGYLIIDIDPRNGGNKSYDALVSDTGVDFKKDAGFVVYTGGGGWHIYYKYEGEKLLSHVKKYPGIDFKSSGYVVGCGSLHVSGMSYEQEKGSPFDISSAPKKLIDMLTPEVKKATFTADHERLDSSKVADMLSYIDCNEYEQWVECGMICHDELGDDGFKVWDAWSQKGETYNPETMSYKWHSFGKSQSKVTIGTLIQKAKDNGYQESVTFETTLTADPLPLTTDIDLTKPPGLVGDCTEYINACCRFPRKNLAVSAALMAVSSSGGMRFEDIEYNVTPNLFTFNVAGSATGKEAVQQAHNELLIASGVGGSVYGTIKSEQEILRNVARHQSLNYLIDEFGILLNKIEQSSTGGSASYMGGVVGALMSIYSKANGKLVVGADHGEDLRTMLSKRASTLTQLKDNNEIKDYQVDELESVERLLQQLVNGYIDSPFLSLSGYTTPVTFDSLVSYAQATNGFIGRAIIFEEKNNNPPSNPKFKRKPPLNDYLSMKMKALFNGGATTKPGRIEFIGEKSPINTDESAMERLKEIEHELHSRAESAAETNGLEAIVRRSFELVLKVSMVLAMGDGEIRTKEHVEWSYALILRDLDNKINLTGANMAEEEKNLSNEILAKVQHKLDRVEGQTVGTIHNKMRKISKDNIQKALDHFVKIGFIVEQEFKPKRGPKTTRYFIK